MADTITIAGKPYPKTAVYVIGAATAGVLGYAWWTKGLRDAEDEGEVIEDIPIDEIGDERIPTTGIPTPSQYGQGFETNADWAREATDRLQAIGVDPVAASSAIGKFLQRKPLNKVEADLVRQAIAQAGYPPDDGPWTIIEESTPAAVGLPAPTGIKGVGTGNSIRWTWNPVSGATRYDVELTMNVNDVVRRASVTDTFWETSGLTPNKPYRLLVWAINSANQKGAQGTTTANSGTGGLAAPRNVTAIQIAEKGAIVGWQAGGTPIAGQRYYWQVQSLPGGRKVKEGTTSKGIVDVRGLLPKHVYLFAVRATAGGSKSPDTMIRFTTK